MAGRRVQKRGLTTEEFQSMTRIVEEEVGDTMKTILRLRRWFNEISISKYMAGYYTGYKRGVRGSHKDHFDEDQRVF